MIIYCWSIIDMCSYVQICVIDKCCTSKYIFRQDVCVDGKNLICISNFHRLSMKATVITKIETIGMFIQQQLASWVHVLWRHAWMRVFRCIRNDMQKNNDGEYDHVTCTFAKAPLHVHDCRNESRAVQHGYPFWLVLEFFWLHRWSYDLITKL